MAGISKKPSKPKTSNDLNCLWNESTIHTTCAHSSAIHVQIKFQFRWFLRFFLLFGDVISSSPSTKEDSREEEKDAWLFIVIRAIGFRTKKSIIESILKIVREWWKNHKKLAAKRNNEKSKLKEDSEKISNQWNRKLTIAINFILMMLSLSFLNQFRRWKRKTQQLKFQ